MLPVNKLFLLLISITVPVGLAAGLEVEIASYPLQTTVDGEANIYVTIMDNSTPLNNTLISFSTNLGNLSATSALTNSSGMAIIRLNSTTAGMATINASIESAYNSSYNTTNVTFLAGEPAKIDINISQNQLVVGNATMLNLTAYDIYNNVNSTANMIFNIEIFDIAGEKTNEVNLTRAPFTITKLDYNRSNLNLANFSDNSSNIFLIINSTVSGNFTITAVTENITGSFNITFIPSALSYISLAYINEQTVNLTSTITVSAWDMFDNPIKDVKVIFNATPTPATKYNSPIEYDSQNLSTEITYTDLYGFASTVFRMDKRAGENIINISAGIINTSLTIQGIADEASDINVLHTPDTVYANNKDTYLLMAQVTDKFLNPVYPRQVPIKEKVLFGTPMGSTLVPLNDSGVAVTLVGPTPYIQTVNISSEFITETYTGIINYTVLNFTTGEFNKLNIYANPDTVLSQNIKGNHITTITLVALDEWGHPVPNINVTLNNTDVAFGDLLYENATNNATNNINATTDHDGRILTSFISKIIAGNATIIASSGSINSSVMVHVKDEPFLSATITFEPNTTINSGDIVNITAIITAEGEVPISRPAASAILVLDRSGSMDPDYYAGTPLDVALVLDRSGSMSGQPLIDVKTASKAFINNMVSNSQVGIVSYSTTSGVDIGLTLLSSLDNKIPVRNAIDGLLAGGMTAMGEGMADANTMLVNGRSDAKKIMIVLTDGNTNEGTDQDGLYAIQVANTNHITIYSIGLGNNLNEQVLRNIAVSTGGKYYNAPTSSDLATIYNSIAQEISDFDASQIHYGVDGFTPYNYRNQSFINAGTTYEYEFLINETINDLKVQLDWVNVSSDMNLVLISPGGHVYGAGNDTVGYYYNDGSTPMNTTEYIWIHPLEFTYPGNDLDIIEYGNWTVLVSGNQTEEINITTYIDKKSALKLGSYAFISSFDENSGDKTGLSLYSFDSVNSSSNQTSFLRGGGTWVGTWAGYFTVDSNGIYVFNLTWNDAANLDIYLYDGATILNSSTGGLNPEIVSSTLSVGKNYHIMVSKDFVTSNDTQFTINVSKTNSQSTMATYYDSNSQSYPRYRQWDSSLWSNEASANTVSSGIKWIVMQSNPVRNEIILGTLDGDNDINVQIWDGSAWGIAQELSTNENSYSRRGFDIAYEQFSGDAMIVYNNNNYVPRYRLWNGSAWSNEYAVNATGAGTNYIRWVRLIAKPNSNEMLLVYLDYGYDLRAQIWNGSAWESVQVLTTAASTRNYQGFDVVYEQETGNAKVVWGESNAIKYSNWNGSSWSTASTIFSDTNPYWIKLASDPNSNNILMSEQNGDNYIYASAWNGSGWSPKLWIEQDTGSYSKRSMDVAFERSSGKGLIVWGDKTTTPKYRTWYNGSLSLEYLASEHGGDDTRWVKLSPDPFSDKIFLMTSDNDNDINIQQWNGSEWDIPSEIETSSSSTYECFDIAYQKHNISVEQMPVNWIEWHASVTSTFNDTISHLNNSIDTMKASGLTAIDEGIFEANNELANISGNSTIVLMTDGLDNAGYHSMMLEALRAKNHNTTIFTIGFGNNESEIDPVLNEIANITGGKYYFAPDASILKSIFRGIASNITNFTAGGPTLNLHLPYNYISGLSLATATYIDNSSNSTNSSATGFIIPTYPQKGNAEPNITIQGNVSILSWKLPNLDPGEKWGIWYQQKVQGAGYVPLMLDTSNITYNDIFGSFIHVNINSAPGVNLGGGGAGVAYIALGNMQLIADPPVVFTQEPSIITVTAKYADGNPAIANATLYSDLGYFNELQNPLNDLMVSGSNSLNFTSNIAGQARIYVIGRNGNNSVNSSVIVNVRPRGKITVS